MREYIREKEEWKEILEEADVEEKKEDDVSIESTEPIQSAEMESGVVKENNEETILTDESQVSEEIGEEAIIKKTKKEFRSRLIMIFILGILIGIAFKTEALKRITIGYNDYLMKIKTQDYDINKMQTDLAKTRSVSEQMQDGSDNLDEEVVSSEGEIEQ